MRINYYKGGTTAMATMLMIISFFVISCSGVNAQSSGSETKLLGEWVDKDNDSLVFKSDGTLEASKGFFSKTYTLSNFKETEYKYDATANMIAMYLEDYAYVLQYSISKDGKTLIIEYVGGGFV
ncbi:MAG: hypothetical protein Ta2G_01820 [Termitinemataceae bacterium]|nr:MAG: hypothetical protein Ta2G_01820 [Termitinemataceae bacterium]